MVTKIMPADCVIIHRILIKKNQDNDGLYGWKRKSVTGTG